MKTNDRNSLNSTTLDKNQSFTGVDDKRRSLAKAGLVAPVLMTLASRPVLAKECTPSVMMSGNLSDPGDLSTCGTCNSLQWLNTDLSNFQDCGIEDPHTESINGIFEIAMFPRGNEYVLDATVMQCLAYELNIHRKLKYKDLQNNSKVKRFMGEKALKELYGCAIVCCLNAMNPWTQIHIGYEVGDLIDQVNEATQLIDGKKNKKMMDYNKLVAMGEYCRSLMSDGSSCALT